MGTHAFVMQSRARSRDLAFEKMIMVRGDHEEVLEILGKTNNNGHQRPSDCAKTTGFPERNQLFPKRGGWRGGGSKMAKSPRKRSSLWPKVTVMDRIEVQIVRVWAHSEQIRVSS